MQGLSYILLGTTAMERWAGTRRLGPRFVPPPWMVWVGVVVLCVLLVLLFAVSYLRQRRSKRVPVEDFGTRAARRELSARERQILLAIALRSGLPHTREIFQETEAFQRGMVELLAECARTRTVEEIDDLKAEIARLRVKLGFQKDFGGLNHTDEILARNRRRFPRVAVRMPALIAPWPFLPRDTGAQGLPSQAADAEGPMNPSPLAGYVPEFVGGMVTELSGPGLQIETSLQVHVDDRVLVLFRLAEEIDAAPALPHAVASVGRVRHGRDLEHQTAIPDAIDRILEGSATRDFHARAAGTLSIAIELTDLSEEEFEELVSATNRLVARAGEPQAPVTGSSLLVTGSGQQPTTINHPSSIIH
jgi:hypothetical protein